jgi:hypothetical protein
VDRWLADNARTLSTSTLAVLHQCLNRAINRAMARDQVKRNVVALCSVPKGRPGRPSKSLSLQQAGAVLAAAEVRDGALAATWRDIATGTLAEPDEEFARRRPGTCCQVR